METEDSFSFEHKEIMDNANHKVQEWEINVEVSTTIAMGKRRREVDGKG